MVFLTGVGNGEGLNNEVLTQPVVVNCTYQSSSFTHRRANIIQPGGVAGIVTICNVRAMQKVLDFKTLGMILNHSYLTCLKRISKCLKNFSNLLSFTLLMSGGQ